MNNPSKFSGLVFGFALTAMLMILTWTSGVAAEVSFKEEVFPIIQIRCLSCHQPGGAGYEKSGLDLRTYGGLMKGTKHGSIITPGSALESNLIAVIEQRTAREIWMPHEQKKLSKCERQTFRFWVSQGARDN